MKQFVLIRDHSTSVELANHYVWCMTDSYNGIRDFSDLSKPFDCEHQDILVGKACYYCVAVRVLYFLKSYLNNRIQRVDNNGARSSGSAVNMGVPQGSILGPFPYLMYIIDFPRFEEGI